MRALLLLVVACSSHRVEPNHDARPAAQPVTPAGHWLAGDVHMHVAPPDSDDVTASIADITKAALDQGMDFIVLTPHVWDSQWRDDGPAVRRAWSTFATDARGVKRPTLIPGIEWTTARGHFVVTGVDIATLSSPDLLTAAHRAGAFISVNHAFAVPTHIPNVRISDFNMSYRVWTERAPGFTAIDSAEVWNVPLSLANLVARPGGRTGEERAWTEMNRVVHEEHRAITAVGGTDDHHGHALATTWVFAADATESHILAALRSGATCVGGPEAGSFRARGTGDWVSIGGTVSGAKISLAWTGVARLFVDDVDRGEYTDGFSLDTGTGVHTFRIVAGRSRSGFIYANL